jgi:5-methylcytosine-specific restriction endonuclease McrA
MHSERCEPCRVVYWKAHNQARNKERTESGARKVYDKRYRENNLETVQANGRKYKAAHPETDEAANARRRAQLKVRMTPEDCRLSRLFRKVSKGFPCFYCGAPVPVGAKPHELEHYFPLSKDGTDHWWNLLRACRACNRGPGGKGKSCGTVFLLRRLAPGADWPRPVALPGFPPMPAIGTLFQRMEAAALDRELLRLF